MTEQRATTSPIILVPGFWLGAWAWDEVVDALRADGHDVTAITLPGLESADADRSSITFEDHVDAIVEAVEAAPAPVVLAVHSASGFSGYAASDRVPEKIAAMVYVDTAPGIGPLDPDFEGAEKPMVWEEIEQEENLDGLTEEQKETFRQRAVPVPGNVLRESVELTNDARRDIPSTLICTGFTAEQYQTYARQPLADVVPPSGARADRRRRRQGTRRRPMTASLLDDAMAHHVWATERLIDACGALTPDQLSTPAAGTYGSIIDTFRHLVSTDCWYLTFFGEQPQRIEEGSDADLDELRSAITGNGKDWMELLARGPDGEADVVEHGDGWNFHSPTGFRLAQVIQHGTDHRSQICTALTSIGVEPPPIDLWAYGEATSRTRPEYL
jgi:uncharacterized damage-inducible protein DinB